MGKYKVGVGESFPVDQPEQRQEPEPAGDDERGTRWRDGGQRRQHWRYGAFQATVILLGIWAVLHTVNGYGPKGLLIAAGIVFAVGMADLLFGRRRCRERDDGRRREQEARR